MDFTSKMIKGFAIGILTTGGIMIGSAATYFLFKDKVDWAIIKMSTNSTIERTAIWAVRETNGDWLSLCLKKIEN